MKKKNAASKVKPEQKIECEIQSSDGQPLSNPIRKSREFRILVQCMDQAGTVKRQAIFSELSKARGYIQIREACDNLTALPSVIELDPEVVGTWIAKVTIETPGKK